MNASNEICFIPYSAKRYSISIYGVVYDSNGKEIPARVEDSKLVVELEWVFGKKEYMVAMLVLISFDKVGIPYHLWDSEIRPLFIDGNSLNCSLKNLSYDFNTKPLPAEGHEGFYYVPFTKLMAINEKGEILNCFTGAVKKWSIILPDSSKNKKGGYRYTRINTEDGVSKVLFRHRCMGYVFKNYPANVMSLVINHLDSNPENDELDNLEWTTYSRNNQHAYDNGLRITSAAPILFKDLRTNEVLRFVSQAACAKHLGLKKPSLISDRLKYCPAKVFSDLWLFKFDDGTPWPEVNVDHDLIYRNNTPVALKNVFTGEITILDCSNDAAEMLKVGPGLLRFHAAHNLIIPINGYNIRYYFGRLDIFPEHSERELLIYKKHPLRSPDGLIMENIKTKKEIFYTSVKEFAQEFKLALGTVNSYMTSGKTFKEEFRLKHFKLRRPKVRIRGNVNNV